jgi:hypothetical protein
MRWIAGLFIVLVTALPVDAQVPQGKKKLANYYPLKPGSKWTYQVDPGNGTKVEVINQIAKNEAIDGKSMARLEATVNGNVAATEHLTSTSEGIFRCRYNGVEVSPPLCIFKTPFKEGTTWETDASIGAQKLTVKSASGKFEDVTVPAGKYTTLPIMTETTVNGTKIKATLWFAPDVGIVKQDTEIGDRSVTMVLLKFEDGR